MKFQKTINLWADGVQDAIVSGELKIQAGQWVSCGVGVPKARFAGVSQGGSIYVAHPNAGGKTQMTRLRELRHVLTHQKSRG